MLSTRCLVGSCIAALLVLSANAHGVQEMFLSGQNVAPVFEGWEKNADGSFDMVFGYFNRNWDEALDVPVGPANSLQPGGPDRGQPTHFLPNRNKFVFRVTVPQDFGDKELVWTVTAHGRTEKAYATLKPDYIIDKAIIMRGFAGFFGTKPDELSNVPPIVRIEDAGPKAVKVGQALSLTAVARDADGMPKASPAPPRVGRVSALGLRVAWFVYRGAGAVTFTPDQFKVYQDTRSDSPWTPGWSPPPVPADGRYPVDVSFRAPGTFVLRVMAHDGALAATEDVTVTVRE
jgi:hypothetical protein